METKILSPFHQYTPTTLSHPKKGQRANKKVKKKKRNKTKTPHNLLQHTEKEPPLLPQP